MWQKVWSFNQKMKQLKLELDELKTVPQLLQRIPERFLERLAFLIISIWLGSPLLILAQHFFTNPAHPDPNGYKTLIMLNWVQFLNVLGNLGLILTVTTAAKIACKNQVDGDNWRNYLTTHLFPSMFFALFIWSFFASIFSKYSYSVWQGSLYRQEGFTTLIAYAGLLGSSSIIKNQKYLFKATFLFILTAVPVAGHYLFDMGSVGPIYATGIFYNLNHTAYYLLLSLFAAISLYLADDHSGNKSRILLPVITILSFALIYNNSLGPYLAALCGLALLFLGCHLKPTKPNTAKHLILIVLIFLAISVYYNLSSHKLASDLSLLGKDIKQITQNTDDANHAGSGRWVLWKVGVELVLESPVFGHGPDSLAQPYANHGITTLERPHNEFIYYAASMGIPALLFYLAALIEYYRQVYLKFRKMSWFQFGLVVTATVYLISSLFGNTMFYTTPFFFVLLGMSYRSLHNSEQSN